MQILIFSTVILPLIYVINAAPTGNTQLDNTFLNSIKDRCPQFFSDRNLMNPEKLEECTDWEQISSTKDLNEKSEQNVLCLLYHDSFSSFCDEIKKHNITNVDIDSTLNSTHIGIGVICKKELLPIKHILGDKINKEDICYKLCTNYDGDTVYECAMAHYFANFNFNSEQKSQNDNKLSKSSQVPVAQQTLNGDEESNQQKLKSSSVDHKPQGSSNSRLTQTPETKLKKDTEPQLLTGPQQLTTSDKKEEKTTPETKPKTDTESQHLTGPQQLTTSDKKVEKTAPEAKPNTFTEPQHLTGPQQLTTSDKKEEKTAPETKPNTDQSQENLETPQEHVANDKKDSVVNQSSHNADDLNQKQDSTTMQKTNNQVTPEKTQDNTNTDDIDVSPVLNEDSEDNFETDAGVPDLPPAAGKELENQETPQQEDKEVEHSIISSENTEETDGDSYFFSYFMVICVVFILGYVGYHNRLKIMALVLEGKRNKRQYRGRRPNSANYHKLDSNLEEAISSNVTKNSSNVIY